MPTARSWWPSRRRGRAFARRQAHFPATPHAPQRTRCALGEWEVRGDAPAETRFHFQHGYHERGAVAGCVRDRQPATAGLRRNCGRFWSLPAARRSGRPPPRSAARSSALRSKITCSRPKRSTLKRARDSMPLDYSFARKRTRGPDPRLLLQPRPRADGFDLRTGSLTTRHGRHQISPRNSCADSRPAATTRWPAAISMPSTTTSTSYSAGSTRYASATSMRSGSEDNQSRRERRETA